MRLWIAMLACLLALPAEAADRVFSFQLNGMGYAMPMPPERFVNAPYLAPRTLKYRSAEEVNKSCSYATGKPEPLGCTILAAPVFCTILINRDLPNDVQKMILWHEDAHCRGWPGDHPTN
jgi:hypothetical protein